jgi:inosine/xanthosine triphosphate pyrophosphatase family protein
MADLGADVKSRLSHRAKAIQAFVRELETGNLVDF